MEHYKKTAKASSRWLRIEASYKKDLHDVCLLRTRLRVHVQLLTIPLVNDDILSPEDVLELPGNSAGDKWRTQPVQSALSARLGEVYQDYMNALGYLQETMAKYSRELKLDDPEFELRASNPPHKSALTGAVRKNLRFERGRIGYALKSTTLEELSREAGKHIGDMERVLGYADMYEHKDGSRARTRVPEFMKKFYLHANRVFHLIQDRLQCVCRSSHCAQLLLGRELNTDPCVRRLFLFAKTPLACPVPWKQRAMSIHQRCTACQCGLGTALASPSAPPSSTTPTLTLTTTLQRPGAQLATPPGQGPFSVDLCATLTREPHNVPCLCVLYDPKDQEEYHMMPVSGPDSAAYVTLFDILGNNNLCHNFLRPYRLNVALKLAQAQLQFHSTPWAMWQWSLKDIYFPQTPQGVSWDSPRIYVDFDNHRPGSQGTPNSEDASFWSLGIVLLELWFGRQFETHPRFNDPNVLCDSTNTFVRKVVATEWAKNVVLDSFEQGSRYAAATKWCLHDFPEDLTDGKWRSEFAKSVVTRLQDCCKGVETNP